MSIEQFQEFDELERQKIDQLESLNNELEEVREDRKEAVVDFLYGIQSCLQSDETVKLVESEEISRGGHYIYEEALTSEGVIATNVRVKSRSGVGEEVSSEQLYGWNGGHWADLEEPKEIETEYLVGERDNPEFVSKLADRIQSIEQDSEVVPHVRRGYD